MMDILSNVWPEWRVVRTIGKGSYGTVYEAERTDSQIGARSAVKVISVPQDRSEVDSLRSEGMTEDSAKLYFRQVVDGFIEEIKIMESFKGVQNIVSVEDYKVMEKPAGIGWDIYIRMELLTPFNSYITDHQMSEREIIQLGADICTALELCARRNVIHRDIKPENIFINAFGDFKLGDFGIARRLENVTGGLSLKGTYNYMAPEVNKGQVYDARVDIYSLGLVLYRLANNNRLPFIYNAQLMLSPNAREEAVRRRLNGEPLPMPSGVSRELGEVILCACSYDPEYRFGNATAMKNALLSVVPAAQKTAGITRESLNETVSVRKAQTYTAEENGGTGSPPPRNKWKIIIPIVAAAAATVLIAVVLIIFLPGLLDKDEPASAGEEAVTAADEVYVQPETIPPAATTAPAAPETPAQAEAPAQPSTNVDMNTGADAQTQPTTQPPTTQPAQTLISVPDLKPGDVVRIGTYEQDGNFANGEEAIEWVTLYEEEGAYLLLSRYCLDALPYDYYGTAASWENSTLRTWLNGDFYDSVFSSAEKKLIVRSQKTKDMVSLLGYDETNDSGVTYFLTSAASRACYATDYAIDNGAFVSEENGHSPWWLRNMVAGSNNAYMVKSTGDIGSNVANNGASSADIADSVLVTIRPIIWIK